MINGGVTLVVAVLAFMSQSSNMVYRIEALENLDYPPLLYKELIDERMQRIKDDIKKLEEFHKPQR